MIGYIALAGIVGHIVCLGWYHLTVKKYIRTVDAYFKENPL